MMATIARGGKKEMVRVVSKIEYKGGTVMTKFKQRQIRGESLAPSTAMRLQKLLREVVENEHGTGRVFYDLPFEVAGKSGTAETGKFKEDKQLHNKWFAGFFPYEKPRFALVTVNLDVFSDEGAVNPLFMDMVKGIYELEQKNGKTASKIEIDANINLDN
nr:penicillin-binding transpeptidase domain-containing protein [Bacillus aquiflavi]